MAFQISLNSRTSEIVREYEEGIELNGPYEVGLKHFVCWNNVYNVTSKNNIFTLVDQSGGTYNIVIPEGNYELDEIINKIEEDSHIQESETVIRFVKEKLKIKIYSKWHIDMTLDNSVGKILGFSRRYLTRSDTHYSDQPIEIISINTVKITCNLVRSNIEDLEKNVNVLYDFPLDVSQIGGKIIKEPNPICYFLVNTDKIHVLSVKITDQSNKIMDFNSELINLTLDFRPLRT